MALSFEKEVRAYLHHRAEQDPTLHALQRGDLSVDVLDLQRVLEMLARIDATQTHLLIQIAQEIDKLRAATNSG